MSSYVTYRFSYTISYAITEKYLSIGTIFYLVFLSSFFAFYAFSGIYGILIDLRQQESKEQSNALVTHIKKCSLVSCIYLAVVIISLLADSNFVYNYIPIGMHHSRPVTGFSKIYQTLIKTSIDKRMPSLLFFVFVSSLLAIAALVVFVIIIKKNHQTESLPQETTNSI